MGTALSKITDGFYIGCITNAKNKENLRSIGITHIVSIHDTAKELYPEDFQYLVLNISDDGITDLSRSVRLTNEFIHRARSNGGKVLIHCLAGRSRSATFAAAYLASATALTLDQALQVVKSVHNVACPRLGFTSQLHKFEKSGGFQNERIYLEETVGPLLQKDQKDCERVLRIRSTTSTYIHEEQSPSDK